MEILRFDSRSGWQDWYVMKHFLGMSVAATDTLWIKKGDNSMWEQRLSPYSKERGFIKSILNWWRLQWALGRLTPNRRSVELINKWPLSRDSRPLVWRCWQEIWGCLRLMLESWWINLVGIWGTKKYIHTLSSEFIIYLSRTTNSVLTVEKLLWLRTKALNWLRAGWMITCISNAARK